MLQHLLQLCNVGSPSMLTAALAQSDLWWQHHYSMHLKNVGKLHQHSVLYPSLWLYSEVHFLSSSPPYHLSSVSHSFFSFQPLAIRDLPCIFRPVSDAQQGSPIITVSEPNWSRHWCFTTAMYCIIPHMHAFQKQNSRWALSSVSVFSSKMRNHSGPVLSRSFSRTSSF